MCGCTTWKNERRRSGAANWTSLSLLRKATMRTADNRLGVTHGALVRACYAADERGSLGRAWKPLR
jgi:hypothetical protein